MTPGPVAVFAWDTSALLHAAWADRLDVLVSDLSRLHGSARHVTTRAVVQELTHYGARLPDAIETVPVDGLDEIIALGLWLQRLASGTHNRGEATVCAWASTHGASVIMDDRSATLVARATGLQVHGTLWICGRALDAGLHSVVSVAAVIEAMAADGARFPCSGSEFSSWWADHRSS